MFHASALLSPYFSQITFFIEEDQITKNKKIVIHEEDFDRKIKLFIHFQNYTLSFILIFFRLIKVYHLVEFFVPHIFGLYSMALREMCILLLQETTALYFMTWLFVVNQC